MRIDGKANLGKAAECCSINSSDNSNASERLAQNAVETPKDAKQESISHQLSITCPIVSFSSQGLVCLSCYLNNPYITVLPRAQQQVSSCLFKQEKKKNHEGKGSFTSGRSKIKNNKLFMVLNV